MERKYGHFLKALSIASGLVLIVLGIVNYATFTLGDPIDIILPFYYIIFGMLMIAAEVNIKCLTTKFAFVEGYIGRGAFYIFVGTLCIRGSPF
jgi:hypothetical protein